MTSRHRQENSLPYTVALLPLGLILLHLVGCALGPGYGAARKEEPPAAKARVQSLQERKERPPRVEQGKQASTESAVAERKQPRREKKSGTVSEKQPDQKGPPSPSGESPLPPAPLKPPNMDGSGG